MAVICVLVVIALALFYGIRKCRRPQTGTGTGQPGRPSVSWSSVGPRVHIDMGPMFFSMNTVDDDDDDEEEEDQDGWLLREMQADGTECVELTTFKPSTQRNECNTGEEETGLGARY